MNLKLQDLQKQFKPTIMKAKVYSATIQWHDNKEIRPYMFIKIGDVEDDDDDIFFYMQNEEELKEVNDYHLDLKDRSQKAKIRKTLRNKHK